MVLHALPSIDRPLRAPHARPRLGPVTAFGVRCVECRERIVPGANFCRFCGRPQPGSRWRPALRLPSREMSAEATLTAGQRDVALVAGLVIAAGLVVAPLGTITLGIAAATALYLAMLGYRLLMFRDALSSPEILQVSDEEALALRDDELPVYSILVPAFHEPEVIGRLIQALDALVYPKDRLDIRILLEADDLETIAAAEREQPGPHVTLVHVPPSLPRTKPKACNVGLAEARGELVTIYDVEDRPDPLQLRRAVVAFGRLPSSVACLQAKLSYHNADQNLITKWFTGEYELWFGQLLPGLVARHAPLPLGGTSNHFRHDVLVAIGGWDAFNVTEDADLGIRLHRLGFRTQVLDSTTLEEANSDFVNWVKQRSRWYKGYLQTWLVHMRHPRTLWRQLGPRGFIGFNLFVGGTPGVALLNPIFWGLTALWFLAHPDVIQALFPAWLYYTGLGSMIVGNAAVTYMAMVSARASDRPSLVLAAAVQPAYWVMMSVAAIKALAQLMSAPSFWEKTTHGLDQRVVEPAERVAA
jgi:glycosyltransferase XagB